MMKAYIMRISIFVIMIMCFIFMAAPVCASNLTVTDIEMEANEGIAQITDEAIPYYKKLSAIELYDKVKECRQSLLETRMDVVKEANDAKLRLEGILKSGKHSAQTIEALKKDLDTIKEAQRVLATILSDIVSATSSETSDAQDGSITQPGVAGGTPQIGTGGIAPQTGTSGSVPSAGGTGVAGNTPQTGTGGIAPQTGTSGSVPPAGTTGIAPQVGMIGGMVAGSRQEIMPSREYLESLVILYDEKTQQLAKIVDSLNGIAVLVN
jgi:hypothetical protein